MTNVYGTPEKKVLKDRLFKIAEEALRAHGWTVERVPRMGKASVRRISKDGISKIACIRTTQNTWIAFPRIDDDTGWRTLDDVDVVVPVSVDDQHDPKYAKVHLIDGNEMRSRFDRAYDARKKAGHSIPIGRGVWVSLYEAESSNPVTYVGAGAGVKHPPIAVVPLKSDAMSLASDVHSPVHDQSLDARPLTISEAKRRLALTYNVEPNNIKITIEA